MEAGDAGPRGADEKDASAANRMIAGVVLLFGFVYLAFEFVAAAAWVDPPYDWVRNYISDLGFSDCAVVDGLRLCSPLHRLMNAGFLVQGTVFTVGSLLVTGFMMAPGALRTTVRVLLVASGVGTVLVGILHLSLALTASGFGWTHFAVATISIGCGNVGLVLLGAAASRTAEWRWYGVVVAVVGVIGLIAAGLLLAGSDLGVGIGAVERVAVYPLNVWTIGTGVGLVASSASEGIRRRRARMRVARAGAGTASSSASTA